MATSLTHIDDRGAARMVEVGPKPETAREATARASIIMRATTAAVIRDNAISKGDVLAVARIAGIMGAKRTSDIVPLCHPITITGVDITFAWESLAPKFGRDTASFGDDSSGESSLSNHRANATDSVALLVHATVRTVGRTGVEMEALTAVAASALTIYDMCKAIDRGMMVDGMFLVSKSGGRSGTHDAPR
jgi:cyclic pyranopterin phosphate synthase